jgi:hypothetical protein
VRASQHVEDLHRLDAALAVTDEHRANAFALVVPRDQACLLLGAFVRAARQRLVADVADARFRVPHPSEEA